ncbi:DUF1906 domain-containing protein [Bacillus cereus]
MARIYFAVDFDPTSEEIEEIILPHFKAINNKMKESDKNRYKTGYSEYGALRYPELGDKDPEHGNPNPHWVDYFPKA